VARQFDVFYAQQDTQNLNNPLVRSSNAYWRNEVSLNGAQKLEPYATELTVQFANPASYGVLLGLLWAGGRNYLHPGQRLTITDASSGEVAHVEVVRPYTSTTSITVRPIHSGADTIDESVFSASGRTFADGSIVAPTWTDASVCVIDLREAPADPRGYTYALATQGWTQWQDVYNGALSGGAGLKAVSIESRLLGSSPPDDPFVGDIYQPARVTTGVAGSGGANYYAPTGGTTAPMSGGIGYNFNHGGWVDLEPGGIYYFRHQFKVDSNIAVSTVSNIQAVADMYDSRITALRFDKTASTTFIAALYDGSGATATLGDGKTEGSQTWDISSGTETVAGVTPTAVDPQFFLGGVCITSTTNSLTSEDPGLDVDIRHSGIDATSQFSTAAANDYNTLGLLAKDDGGATNIAIAVASQQSGTQTAITRYAFAISFAPLFLAAPASVSGDAADYTATTNATAWVEAEASTGDVSDRDANSDYLEISSVAFGCPPHTRTEFSYWAELRSTSSNPALTAYSTDMENFGRMYSPQYPLPSAITAASDGQSLLAGYNFQRSRFTAAMDDTAVIKQEARTPKDSGGAEVYSRYAQLASSKERTPIVVPTGTPTTVVLKANTGIVLKGAWSAGSALSDGSFNFQVDLPVTQTEYAPGGPAQLLGGVVEVWRNGVKLNQVTKAVYDAGTWVILDWYFDKTNRRLHVRMGGASDNNLQPVADNCFVVAVVPLYLGRTPANLTNTSDDEIPYQSRLAEVPGSRSQLSSGGGIVRSGSSLGSFTLVNSDGVFDDLVVRRIWEGQTAELLIGFEDVSNNESDFDVYQTGTMAVPQGNMSSITVRLLDATTKLDRRLSGAGTPTGKVTVQTGDPGGTPVEVEDQDIPFIFGTVRRVIAYRVSTTSTAGTNSDYIFASNVCYDVVGAYVSRDSSVQDSMAVVSSKTLALAGKVRVLNSTLASKVSGGAAFASSQIPDQIYVDVQGEILIDATRGDNGDRPMFYPGEILKKIFSNPGDTANGLIESEIDNASLDLLDRRWRRSMATVYNDPDAGSPSTTIGSRFILGRPPYTGATFPNGTTVRQAANEIAESVFAYLRANRAGRVGVGVADYTSDNLIQNGSFEAAYPEVGGTADTAANSMVWPWYGVNSATLTRASKARYIGSFGGLLYNGENYRAAIEQSVDFSLAGTYAVTLVAAEMNSENGGSGAIDKFRIGIVSSDGEEILGDAQTVSDANWTTISATFEVPFGLAGKGKVRVYPYYGDDASDNAKKYCYVDAIQCYRVVAQLDTNNSDVTGWQFDVEMYESAMASYDVTADSNNRIRIRATNNEAIGLNSTEGEAAATQRTSGSANLSYQLYDAPSAAGVAAAVAGYYGRQRIVLDVVAYSLTPNTAQSQNRPELGLKLPVVGDRIFLSDFARVPSQYSQQKIWRVDGVDFKGGTAQEVRLAVSQPIDVINRKQVVFT
jgi:hypothetical protein